jgi:hypothetical protein
MRCPIQLQPVPGTGGLGGFLRKTGVSGAAAGVSAAKATAGTVAKVLKPSRIPMTNRFNVAHPYFERLTSRNQLDQDAGQSNTQN